MPSMTQEKRLGDILIEAGLVSPLEMDEALQRQRLSGEMLGRILVQMGLCEEQDIVEALGIQAGMERVDLSRLQVPDEILRKLDVDVVKFYNVVPVREEDGALVVATCDPLNLAMFDDLRQIVGGEIKGAISSQEDIAKFIENNYGYGADSVHESLTELVERVGEEGLTDEEMGQQQILADEDNLVALAQEPEVIKIVNLVFLEAVQKRASDIHLSLIHI